MYRTMQLFLRAKIVPIDALAVAGPLFRFDIRPRCRTPSASALWNRLVTLTDATRVKLTMTRNLWPQGQIHGFVGRILRSTPGQPWNKTPPTSRRNCLRLCLKQKKCWTCEVTALALFVFLGFENLCLMAQKCSDSQFGSLKIPKGPPPEGDLILWICPYPSLWSFNKLASTIKN